MSGLCPPLIAKWFSPIFTPFISSANVETKLNIEAIL